MANQGDYDLVIAIHPQHAESILAGTKTVELRSRFPQVPSGTRVYLYATAPVSAVIGGFHVGGIDVGTAEEVWGRNSRHLAITFDEFSKYAKGQKILKAIEVVRPFRLSRPVGREEMRTMPEAFTAPQGTSYLRPPSLRSRLQLLRA